MSGEPSRVVTLLTDFGTADGYVAALKGVLASAAPDVRVDDAGHDLPRGEVAHASWALSRFWDRYPVGTVHVVVVDPGVGTSRRAVAVEAGGRFGVGPDNGVFTRVLRMASSWRAVVLQVPSDACTTFHGRDVFAPAGARLAAGVALEELGTPVEALHLLPEPSSGSGRGSVQTVDRFGNLVTDIPSEALQPDAEVEIGGRKIQCARTYGDVAPGALVAVVGSDGTVEVAVRDGSASSALGVGVGAVVRVR